MLEPAVAEFRFMGADAALALRLHGLKDALYVGKHSGVIRVAEGRNRLRLFLRKMPRPDNLIHHIHNAHFPLDNAPLAAAPHVDAVFVGSTRKERHPLGRKILRNLIVFNLAFRRLVRDLAEIIVVLLLEDAVGIFRVPLSAEDASVFLHGLRNHHAAGLFANLADERLYRILAGFDAAAGEFVVAELAGVHEQKLPVFLNDSPRRGPAKHRAVRVVIAAVHAEQFLHLRLLRFCRFSLADAGNVPTSFTHSRLYHFPRQMAMDLSKHKKETHIPQNFHTLSIPSPS